MHPPCLYALVNRLFCVSIIMPAGKKCNGKKTRSLPKSSGMLLLFVVRNIFHDVLHPAVQNAAEVIDGNCFNHHILSQTVQLGVINAIVSHQFILADIFSL